MGALVERSIEVAAPAHAVWRLVSDLPAMGRFSPENTGGRWTKGTGPDVGASFRGTNAQGRRRWSTRATVTRSVPGEAFAFSVSSVGLPVADWSYVLTPTGQGCRVTETWQDRRGTLVTRAGALMTGVQDREGYAAKSMEKTLQELKAFAEADAAA